MHHVHKYEDTVQLNLRESQSPHKWAPEHVNIINQQEGPIQKQKQLIDNLTGPNLQGLVNWKQQRQENLDRNSE